MLYASNFVIEEIQSRTMSSNEQNFKNRAFKMSFRHLKNKVMENFELNIKLN